MKDLEYINHSLIQAANSQNSNFEKQSSINAIYYGVGYNGEQNVLQYNNGLWDPIFELVEKKWRQKKTLEITPELALNSYLCDYYITAKLASLL